MSTEEYLYHVYFICRPYFEIIMQYFELFMQYFEIFMQYFETHSILQNFQAMHYNYNFESISESTGVIKHLA